jgi:hypothetical protein
MIQLMPREDLRAAYNRDPLGRPCATPLTAEQRLALAQVRIAMAGLAMTVLAPLAALAAQVL